MNVSVKRLPKSQVEIQVSLPWEEWRGEFTPAVERLAKEVRVAGFRPGRAPRAVIEKRFGSEAVVAEAVELAVRHAYPKALEQERIVALGKPEVRLGAFSEGQTLEFTAVTAVMPEVRLKSWEDAVKKANREAASREAGVAETEIDAALAHLAEMRAPLVTVSREARVGDGVLVDFEVFQDGVIIEGGKSEKHPLVLGKGAFIPGFEEALVGLREGETKTMILTFPAEYHAKHLAGKPAEFRVKLGLVRERRIPTLDDVFAASVGNFRTLAELRASVRAGMFEEKKRKREEDRRAAILDALVAKSEIDVPDILVEEELERMFREFRSEVQSSGLEFESYLEQTKKTEAAMRAEWSPQARKRLSAHLILGHLAEARGVTLDSAEIEAEMNKALAHYRNIKDAEKNIDMERLYAAVSGQMKNEKVFEWLEKL